MQEGDHDLSETKQGGTFQVADSKKLASKTQRDFAKLTRGGGSNGSNLNDKSYTQNISEASRDDTMILKPQNILKNLLAGNLES
jgi:hypothetical protein